MQVETGSRPRLGSSSHWTLYAFHRSSGSNPDAPRLIVVLEPIAPLPGEPEYRVWCREMLQDDEWWMVEGVMEQERVRLTFPFGEYELMPAYLDLELPRRPTLGQRCRLLREDGQPHGVYELRQAEEVSRAKVEQMEAFYRNPTAPRRPPPSPPRTPQRR